MKYVVITICLWCCCTHTVIAQLTPPSTKKPIVVTTQTSPGLQSQQTRQGTTPVVLTKADYWLAVVKVTIGTGSDNKESLSNVSIELSVRNENFQNFSQHNINNELKINSSVTIGLDKSNAFTSSWNPNAIPPMYSTTATGTKPVSLADVEAYGLAVRIIYKPNFFTDAWKIENVSATLEFRDAKGNLYPVAGQKKITFSNAGTFLDDFDKRILICTADGFFNPLTSFVTKDFLKRW